MDILLLFYSYHVRDFSFELFFARLSIVKMSLLNSI